VGVPEAFAAHGADGEGVLVGVLDSGLDWEHPSFRKPDGSSRVLGMLDFAYPGDIDGDGQID
jgi:hypothetical protein